ncbi:hypothetical protein C5Z26_02140 [Lactobacillus sp. CBA3606]|uniref:hypothetical protein n=1 Tax=Lactobacillus sp. CBA3606 TaxID=2099789 RepID=UPI000CFD9932|nr:hypothetical protein [Lactobacillus sp. CBA3606]AVK62995.1 hypothetical protein C5Z26_02140 [Lactobacillus sp. CBA3606]
MQNSVQEAIVSCVFIMVILYLLVVSIVLTFVRSFHISVGPLHFKARFRARKSYVSMPMKNNPKIRKAYIRYLIISALTALSIVGQLIVMQIGYPVEAAVVGCTLYGLEWWSAKAVYLLRDYWEKHDTKAAGLTLASKEVFKIRMTLYKSTIIGTTIMTLSFMIYMLNFGVYF